MRSFKLTLTGEGPVEAKDVEFDAYDTLPAFHILEREEIGRIAILWEGPRRLGTLRRTSGGWQINA